MRMDRQTVWDTFLDPDALAACMPGCEGLTPVGPDEYTAKMTVKVASIGGSFQGRITLLDRREPESFVMRVEGGGGPGRVTGEGILRLIQHAGTQGAETTEVAYDGDVQIAGAIAAVGQRLLGVTAKMMIGRFFDCMEQRIEGAAKTSGY